MNSISKKNRTFLEQMNAVTKQNDSIDRSLYPQYGVKRGLRDENGRGVVTGLTNISLINSFERIDENDRPCDGELYYRGYRIEDLVNGFVRDDRFGFEESAFLLLFGKLPDEKELQEFKETLNAFNHVPSSFTRDVIMKAAGTDMMNSLTKSVLSLSSYDEDLTNLDSVNVLRQCLYLISIFPSLAVYGYQAFKYFTCGDSFFVHHPDPNLSVAENILQMLRIDRKYTKLEAKLLDLALVLHMEHGGGNNSTFTTRVITSSGADTYAVMAAALCSLKGPKHGGANRKVVDMMRDLKEQIADWKDDEQIRAYLTSLLDKNAFDRSGLIYGFGHAVYSKSDPRALLFRQYAAALAHEKGWDEEFDLYRRVEQLATEVIAEKRRIYKGVCANVDFYSGFVYQMLDIPKELYTPLFAIARIVGWSAHRIEELFNMDKIIRPAYQSLLEPKEYTAMDERREE